MTTVKILTILLGLLLIGCVNKRIKVDMMDKTQIQCSCKISEQDTSISTTDTNSKTLRIKWQRLIVKEETCPRCESTEQEIEEAVAVLKQSLAPLGIEVILEKKELTDSEFKQDPLQSNRIWINDKPFEDYIEGSIDQSPCGDVCGTSECRTIEIEGEVYETIPSEIIIKAGLIAASQLVTQQKSEPCCGSDKD